MTIHPLDTSITVIGESLSANIDSSTYRWLDCNNNFAVIAGETAQTFTANINGTYAVEISTNFCKDTSACYSINNIAIGISEKNLDKNLKVFPNPSNGQIQVELNNATFQSISILNVLGQEIYFKEIQHLKRVNLDIPGEKGIYFIKVQTSDGQFEIVKVLKQ